MRLDDLRLPSPLPPPLVSLTCAQRKDLSSQFLTLGHKACALWSIRMSQSADTQLIITTFIDEIHPAFNFVVVVTAFSACLLTLLVVLFAFSTPQSRKRPVFRLNVIAILLATVLSVLNGVTSGGAILAPFHAIPESVYVATIFFAIFPPLFYDSILLTRLLALYPIGITSNFELYKVFAFPVCIKCGRLVALVCANVIPFLLALTVYG